MENPKASVSAVNYMIDKIIEGKTIASVPHRSDMWNVASKPCLNESLIAPRPCLSALRSIPFPTFDLLRSQHYQTPMPPALERESDRSGVAVVATSSPLSFTGHAVRCGFGTSSWISAICSRFLRLHRIFNQSHAPSSTPLTSPVAPPDPPSSLSTFSPAGDTAPPSICS
jgi:hypothetical protein